MNQSVIVQNIAQNVMTRKATIIPSISHKIWRQATGIVTSLFWQSKLLQYSLDLF